jgi:hypothetical protein
MPEKILYSSNQMQMKEYLSWVAELASAYAYVRLSGVAALAEDGFGGGCVVGGLISVDTEAHFWGLFFFFFFFFNTSHSTIAGLQRII